MLHGDETTLQVLHEKGKSLPPAAPITVPTAKSVVDFHHLVIAHAGRTKKTAPTISRGRC